MFAMMVPLWEPINNNNNNKPTTKTDNKFKC